MKRAIDDVKSERSRQIVAEGFSNEHDDGHTEGELLGAAAAYCIESLLCILPEDEKTSEGLKGISKVLWPWEGGAKTSSYRRNLIKAAALLIAEVERIDRKENALLEETTSRS